MALGRGPDAEGGARIPEWFHLYQVRFVAHV
jgi:hypothetical protein